MIYLDHNATSPMLAEVLEVMLPWCGVPGNAGSVHRAGQRAAVAVERARVHVAALVGGIPEGVVFTSGATEANHGYLTGAYTEVGGPIACSRAEHPSVWATAEHLGWQELAVDECGRTLLPDVASVLSVQAANHETGVIQSSPAGKGQRVHVDATQAAGRIVLSMDGIDGLTLSSHKLGGPPGIGALVLTHGEPFVPWVRGGNQERARRAGTVPTALAVGFGEACRLALLERDDRVQRWTSLSKLLCQAGQDAGGQVLGAGVPRVANTVALSFPGLLGETLVQALDLRGICVSSGAACASGSTRPSPVLVAMGHPEPRSGLRFSLGPRTTRAEVVEVTRVLAEVLVSVRAADDFE